MSVFDMFKRNRQISQELNDILDYDFVGLEAEQRLYLKQSAIETCVNLMGRTISTADFRFTKNNKRIDHDFDYMLNVRPNSNQSAAEFWKDFIYTLLVENEVLVILSDSNEFLIADSFEKVEYAIYEDKFKNVVVKDYKFKRTFEMSKVIYMTYNNKKFSIFLDGMFKDYTELFSRMVETKMYENQIRATAEIETTQKLDKDNIERLTGFIKRMYNSFKTNAFAIVPKTKGFNYEEITKGTSTSSQPVKELEELRQDTTKQVANILGIPSALVFGDLSEYETAMKAFIRLTARPLIGQIKDELTSKLIEESAYKKGLKLSVYGVSERNPIEDADSADKMVASGSWSRNEVREKFGDERVDDPRMDEYVITKNYQTLDELEGGENE